MVRIPSILTVGSQEFHLVNPLETCVSNLLIKKNIAIISARFLLFGYTVLKKTQLCTWFSLQKLYLFRCDFPQRCLSRSNCLVPQATFSCFFVPKGRWWLNYPGRLIWNLKSWWFGSDDFPDFKEGWFWGSMLIFRGIYETWISTLIMWFQQIWKICVKLSDWIISSGRGENKKHLKPPPRTACVHGDDLLYTNNVIYIYIRNFLMVILLGVLEWTSYHDVSSCTY